MRCWRFGVPAVAAMRWGIRHLYGFDCGQIGVVRGRLAPFRASVSIVLHRSRPPGQARAHQAVHGQEEKGAKCHAYLGELLIHAPCLCSSRERGAVVDRQELSEWLSCLCERASPRLWSARRFCKCQSWRPGCVRRCRPVLPVRSMESKLAAWTERWHWKLPRQDGGRIERSGERESAAPSCAPSQTACRCIRGGGVSQGRDWLTDLQTGPQSCQGLNLQYPAAAAWSASCSPARARRLPSAEPAPTPAHKRPQQSRPGGGFEEQLLGGCSMGRAQSRAGESTCRWPTKVLQSAESSGCYWLVCVCVCFS